MQNPSPDDPDGELPPPGTRWGAGAHSVLPYLARSLQSRPAQAPEHRERDPQPGPTVFTHTPPRAG